MALPEKHGRCEADVELEPAVLDDLVQRILNVVQPARMVLFGSAARSTMTPDSDLDVLVVVPRDVDRASAADAIYINLIGFCRAVDIVLVTEDELSKFGSNPSLVYYPALREGKEIYAA